MHLKLNTKRNRFNLHKDYVDFSFVKHCLAKSMKIQKKDSIAKEANELAKVATASVKSKQSSQKVLLLLQ